MQSGSTLPQLLSFLCSIGMATLAQPHSYSLPILVIGLTHEASTQALQQELCLVTSASFLSPPLSLLLTLTYCTRVDVQMRNKKEEVNLIFQVG